MIKFEGVSKTFAGTSVLEDLSFKLNKGDKCGLVGRNGSGKTTLLKMITGEESIDAGTIEAPKEYSIGYLTQYLSFSSSFLIEEVAQHLPANELYKAETILFGLGFKEKDLQTNPSAFSGGYQLRIHLAKVLLQEPDCLLLDEPTNYLDIVSIRWMVKFLRGWKRECILISHDRDFMDQVTTHILGIHRKKVKKVQGGTENYYNQLLQEEQIYERTRQNLDKKREHLQTFITRFGAKATKATQAQSRKKALARLPILEELAKLHHLDFQFPYAPFPGQRMIEATHLSFTYDTLSQQLIPDLSFSLDKGECVAIIGKNGRGKSTLLQLIAQEIKPQKGDIRISPNVKIGYFGQSNIDRLHPQMTVEEEIASASIGLSISEIRRICGVMMFPGDLSQKSIHVLSGGERSRVLLGKILVSSCNLLLLDEPTNHLDMESIEALITALDTFEGAVVLVTHSEMILRVLPSKFIVCHQGNQRMFVGDYTQFLEKEGWEAEESKKRKTKPQGKHHNAERTLLKPIQKQIEVLEQRILRLEVEVDEGCQQLINASKEGKGSLISELSKTIDEKRKQIELLFNELEILTTEYEEKRVEFDIK